MKSETKMNFRLLLFVAQGGCCIYCGGEMSLTRRKNGYPARDFATFEHIERREQGGKFDASNIVLAHYKCNIKRNAGEAIKIGFAQNVRKRVAALQISHHFPLFLLGSIPATDHEERVIHRRFARLRIKGEWFKIHDDILLFIDEFEAAGVLIPGERMENYMRQFEPGNETKLA